MPQNTFSGTGITDGSTIEASQVSQSVDAFTGAADYRITTTGSLTLSGSLNMSGSFVNEFTGQFSALGIGVTAPTAPTMLHIKDTSIAADPIVLLEGATGTDSARIRFSNADVMYDVGAYGSSGDSFMIIQDQTGTPKFQFIIGKDEPSYALQIHNGVVGSGMGASFSANPSSLADGSIQAAATVSGSLLSGVTISASAAGPSANIHGTASWASNVITANSASYVKLENVDNNYSASGIFNSAYNIASTQTSSAHIYQFGKATSALVDSTGATLISGSGGGNVFIGGVDDSCFIQTKGTANEIIIDSGGTVYIKDDAIVDSDLRVSGSATPSLIVGPNSGAPGSNNPSASLFHDSLEFFKANNVVVANYNNSSGAQLLLGAGGTVGADTAGLRISSSSDVVSNVKLITRPYQKASNSNAYGQGLIQYGMLYNEMGGSADDLRGTRQVIYSIPTSILSASDPDEVIWRLNWPQSCTSLVSTTLITIEVELTAHTTSTGTGYAGWKFVRQFKKASSANGVLNRVGVKQDIYTITPGGISISTTPDLAVASSYNIDLTVGSSSDSLTYGGIVKVTSVSKNVNPETEAGS